MNSFIKKSYILPVLIFSAIGLVVLKIAVTSPIEHEELGYPPKTVEVITARKLPFRTRAIAFGSVEPSTLLKVKTEVSGKISYIHPSLKKGASLLKGTVVLRIEPTTFEFSLDQSKAGLRGSRSALDQLDVEEASTGRTLEIARKNLQAEEKEFNRILSVWEKRLIARTLVDAEEQKVLQIRQQVEDLEGKLASFVSRKSVIQSQITQSEARLAQSEDTLIRTEIRLPFDARIGDVFVEAGEYTSTGSLLFEALGTQAVEIVASLPLSQLYQLLAGLGQQSTTLEKFEDFQALFPRLELDARVRLVGNDDSIAFWHGELLRIGESIDPVRDTIGLVVSVDNPYAGIVPGRRPPLLKGMYASVRFLTPPRDMLVLPRKAIHQGRVYVAKANNQLEIRNIDILFKQGQLVVIRDQSGLKEGERVIISDVIPVLDGLPLKPVHAVEYEKQLVRIALGDDISE